MKYPWILRLQFRSFDSRLQTLMCFTYLYVQNIKYVPASFAYVPTEVLRMKMHPSLKTACS